MEGDEAQVRRGAPAADEPLLVCKFVVEDLQDAARGLDVVCVGGRVGFEDGPVEDALQGGALGCVLELEPLLHVVELRQGGEADEVFRVVLVEDVVGDGAGLCWNLAAGIWVNG